MNVWHTESSTSHFIFIGYSNLLFLLHMKQTHFPPQQGSAIEAEITKADHSLLPVKPNDGGVYLFRQFRVDRPIGGYNATGHDYIIHMTKWT